MLHLTFNQHLHSHLQQQAIDPNDWEIRSLNLVESTNDTAKKLLLYYDKVVVLAVDQSKGRGREGKSWNSSEGGIWMSIGMIIDVPIIELSTPVTKAVHKSLSNYVTCTTKYPNDIIVDNKKLAGILVEGKVQGKSLQNVVIGIGINIHNELSEELHPMATRLADHLETYPSVPQLAAEIAVEVIKTLDQTLAP
ncbi:MAG: biotin--[acetyl-CoA-carboxylase] ligase [Candidatus Kariarchaeaceae archaeon]|jgi:BirA family biotin operon repressor/biotin-[acetyl-CoA-carboxylase] ligase